MKRTKPEPWIWLQDNERSGTAECGCRLVASHKGSGPALWTCRDHNRAATYRRHATRLAEAIRTIITTWHTPNRPKAVHNAEATIHNFATVGTHEPETKR